MIEIDVNMVAFTIGTITVGWHGLMVALAAEKKNSVIDILLLKNN